MSRAPWSASVSLSGADVWRLNGWCLVALVVANLLVGLGLVALGHDDVLAFLVYGWVVLAFVILVVGVPAGFGVAHVVRGAGAGVHVVAFAGAGALLAAGLMVMLGLGSALGVGIGLVEGAFGAGAGAWWTVARPGWARRRRRPSDEQVEDALTDARGWRA